MTCDDCQALLIDLARGDEVDPALRDEARRHAALCVRCGEQQQEQQWLTAQFRGIAAAEAQVDAPERVEIAALAAWRATYATPAPTTASASAPVAMPRRASTAWLLSGVGLSGLAAAALAMLILWPSASARHTSRISTPVASATIAANRTPEPVALTPGTLAEPARNREGEGVDEAGEADEFVALPYVEPLRSTEARHVVRVSMTSSDEMIIGVLPADRRNGQPFEADVLVGEDGIARAIRVVQ